MEDGGLNGDGFQSPYDAEVLPDGNLAVATAQNEGGRIAVYNRTTGALLWKYLINYPHYVELIPAGKGTGTTKPTLLMAGFSKTHRGRLRPGPAGRQAGRLPVAAPARTRTARSSTATAAR